MLELEHFLSRKQAFSKKKVFAGFGVFFCPENKRFPKKVYAGFGAFFVPKTSVLQIKRFLLDLERFLVLNMAQDTGLRGGKSCSGGGGGRNSPGGSCPPTSRTYELIQKFWKSYWLALFNINRIFLKKKNCRTCVIQTKVWRKIYTILKMKILRWEESKIIGMKINWICNTSLKKET